ncbi:MAG: hypothetical protein IJJ26_03230 [Victivallales bacterium]|nr:hypothetical protein [Victivallales bacterium]
MELRQSPSSGNVLVRYAGDSLKILLETSCTEDASAFIRTNYGSASVRRRACIAHVEQGTPLGAGGWQDLPMTACGDGRFELELPLFEVGLFDFKACLVTAAGHREWVHGDNARVKVEPACLIGDNTLYNAFIRQFGPNIAGAGESEAAQTA